MNASAIGLPPHFINASVPRPSIEAREDFPPLTPLNHTLPLCVIKERRTITKFSYTGAALIRGRLKLLRLFNITSTNNSLGCFLPGFDDVFLHGEYELISGEVYLSNGTLLSAALRPTPKVKAARANAKIKTEPIARGLKITVSGEGKNIPVEISNPGITHPRLIHIIDGILYDVTNDPDYAFQWNAKTISFRVPHLSTQEFLVWEQPQLDYRQIFYVHNNLDRRNWPITVIYDFGGHHPHPASLRLYENNSVETPFSVYWRPDAIHIADFSEGLGMFDTVYGYPIIVTDPTWWDGRAGLVKDQRGRQAHAGYDTGTTPGPGKRFIVSIDDYPIFSISIRASPGTRTNVFLYVVAKDGSNLGWAVIGSTPNGDPASYYRHPDYFTIVDDNTWHTYHFDLRKLRDHWPNAAFVSQIEFWDGTGDGDNTFYFDNLYIFPEGVDTNKTAKAEITWTLVGDTPANTTRRYYLYFGSQNIGYPVYSSDLRLTEITPQDDYALENKYIRVNITEGAPSNGGSYRDHAYVVYSKEKERDQQRPTHWGWMLWNFKYADVDQSTFDLVEQLQVVENSSERLWVKMVGASKNLHYERDYILYPRVDWIYIRHRLILKNHTTQRGGAYFASWWNPGRGDNNYQAPNSAYGVGGHDYGSQASALGKEFTSVDSPAYPNDYETLYQHERDTAWVADWDEDKREGVGIIWMPGRAIMLGYDLDSASNEGRFPYFYVPLPAMTRPGEQAFFFWEVNPIFGNADGTYVKRLAQLWRNPPIVEKGALTRIDADLELYDIKTSFPDRAGVPIGDVVVYIKNNGFENASCKVLLQVETASQSIVYSSTVLEVPNQSIVNYTFPLSEKFDGFVRLKAEIIDPTGDVLTDLNRGNNILMRIYDDQVPLWPYLDREKRWQILTPPQTETAVFCVSPLISLSSHPWIYDNCGGLLGKSGMPISVEYVPFGALRFDDTLVEFPEEDKVCANNGFTLVFYLRREESGDDYERLFSKDDVLEIAVDPSNSHLLFRIDGVQTNASMINTFYDTGVDLTDWDGYITFVYNRTHVMVFTDGTLAARFSATGTGRCIRRRINLGKYLVGLLGDVRFYDRAFTSDVIHRTVVVNTTGLNASTFLPIFASTPRDYLTNGNLTFINLPIPPRQLPTVYLYFSRQPHRLWRSLYEYKPAAGLWLHPSRRVRTWFGYNLSSFAGQNLSAQFPFLWQADWNNQYGVIHKTKAPAKPDSDTQLRRITVENSEAVGVLATDGKYLYTKSWASYDGYDRTISKIGTGYFGTIAGKDYGDVATVHTSLSMCYYKGRLFNGYWNGAGLETVNLSTGKVYFTNLPNGIIARSNGKLLSSATSMILITCDSRYLYALSYGINGSSYNGYLIWIYDPERDFQMIRAIEVPYSSYYTDGVMSDGEYIYALQWSGGGSAHMVRISLKNGSTTEWTFDPQSYNNDDPINGQYDWVNNVFWIGDLTQPYVHEYKGKLFANASLKPRRPGLFFVDGIHRWAGTPAGSAPFSNTVCDLGYNSFHCNTPPQGNNSLWLRSEDYWAWRYDHLYQWDWSVQRANLEESAWNVSGYILNQSGAPLKGVEVLLWKDDGDGVLETTDHIYDRNFTDAAGHYVLFSADTPPFYVIVSSPKKTRWYQEIKRCEFNNGLKCVAHAPSRPDTFSPLFDLFHDWKCIADYELDEFPNWRNRLNGLVYDFCRGETTKIKARSVSSLFGRRIVIRKKRLYFNTIYFWAPATLETYFFLRRLPPETITGIITLKKGTSEYTLVGITPSKEVYLNVSGTRTSCGKVNNQERIHLIVNAYPDGIQCILNGQPSEILPYKRLGLVNKIGLGSPLLVMLPDYIRVFAYPLSYEEALRRPAHLMFVNGTGVNYSNINMTFSLWNYTHDDYYLYPQHHTLLRLDFDVGFKDNARGVSALYDNAPSIAKGKVYNAVFLKGTEALRYESSDYYNADNLTIALWFNQTGDPTQEECLFSHSHYGDDGIRLTLDDGYLWIEMAHNLYSFPLKYHPNEWHFLAVTLERLAHGSRLRVYLDGRLIDERYPVVNITPSKDYIRIGHTTGNNWPFKGELDEVLFLSRPLSAAEVEFLYRNPWYMNYLGGQGTLREGADRGGVQLLPVYLHRRRIINTSLSGPTLRLYYAVEDERSGLNHSISASCASNKGRVREGCMADNSGGFAITSPYLSIGDGDFSIAFWLKIGDYGDRGEFLRKGTAFRYFLFNYSKSTLGVELVDGHNEALCETPPIIPARVWFHVLITRQKDTLTWYINGIPVKKCTDMDVNVATTSPLTFRGLQSLTGIDELIILNRSVSSLEAQSLYNIWQGFSPAAFFVLNQTNITNVHLNEFSRGVVVHGQSNYFYNLTGDGINYIFIDLNDDGPTPNNGSFDDYPNRGVDYPLVDLYYCYQGVCRVRGRIDNAAAVFNPCDVQLYAAGKTRAGLPLPTRFWTMAHGEKFDTLFNASVSNLTGFTVCDRDTSEAGDFYEVFWGYYTGTPNGSVVLGDALQRVIKRWNNTRYYLFFFDADAQFDTTRLAALSPSQLSLADAALNVTSELMNETFNATLSLPEFGLSTPAIRTPSGRYTGVLYLRRNAADTYDGSQYLVFVSPVNTSTVVCAFDRPCLYEVKLPPTLGVQNTTTSNIAFYVFVR